MYRTLHTTGSNRTGVTLTEVLMSLLIFSVGVTSVFILFPLSLLSSIQATKLTNSKILADNIVEVVRTDPSWLRPYVDPSLDWEGEWEPQKVYAVNDVVWPRIEPGELLPSPLLLYRCNSLVGMSNNRSGSSEPDWPLSVSGTFNDGNVEWQIIPWTHQPHFVVDPIGRHFGTDPDFNNNNDSRLWFGYDNGSFFTGNTGPPLVTGLRRAAAGIQGPAGTNYYNLALRQFAQPDSWTTVVEDVPLAVTQNPTLSPTEISVTFSNSVDLSQIVAGNHRVVITSSDGESSAVRNFDTDPMTTATPVNGQIINLDLSTPLPPSLDTTAEVSRVRIEAFLPRYSYMITVRRPLTSGRLDLFEKPTVNAVVFFNRNFGREAEEIYTANFASGGSGFTGVPAVSGSLRSDVIRVAWETDESIEQNPLIREGNYVFDAREAIWYKIIDVGTEQTTTPGKRWLDIVVDRPIEVRTPATGNAEDVGRIIFMPGIVEVFEL